MGTPTKHMPGLRAMCPKGGGPRHMADRVDGEIRRPPVLGKEVKP